MATKLQKTEGLVTFLASNIFALLCAFSVAVISFYNKRTSATRTINFLNTSGAPLDDAAGYPKLFRPRRHFCAVGARKIPSWVNLKFLDRDANRQSSKRLTTKILVGVGEQ